MRTEILGVGFDDLTPEEAARRGQALVETEGFHYAVTPNPEFLLAAKKDAPFRRALLGADLVLADGVGVTYAAKILGRPLKGRVTGIGFAQGLMTWMARTGKRLYLLGAKPGVAELAAATNPVPLEFVGVRDRFGKSGEFEELLAYFAIDAAAIVEAVKKVQGRKSL